MDRDKPVRAITSGSRQIFLLSINRSNGREIHALNIFHTKSYKAGKSCKPVRGFIPWPEFRTGMFPANQEAYVGRDYAAENSIRVARCWYAAAAHARGTTLGDGSAGKSPAD